MRKLSEPVKLTDELKNRIDKEYKDIEKYLKNLVFGDKRCRGIRRKYKVNKDDFLGDAISAIPYAALEWKQGQTKDDNFCLFVAQRAMFRAIDYHRYCLKIKTKKRKIFTHNTLNENSATVINKSINELDREDTANYLAKNTWEIFKNHYNKEKLNTISQVIIRDYIVPSLKEQTPVMSFLKDNKISPKIFYYIIKSKEFKTFIEQNLHVERNTKNTRYTVQANSC